VASLYGVGILVIGCMTQARRRTLQQLEAATQSAQHALQVQRQINDVIDSVPGAIYRARYRPAGIAMIHAFGSAGAILSPLMIGFLRDLTGSFSAGLAFAAVLLSISSVLLAMVQQETNVGGGHQQI
jgi:hypothetical protein